MRLTDPRSSFWTCASLSLLVVPLYLHCTTPLHRSLQTLQTNPCKTAETVQSAQRNESVDRRTGERPFASVEFSAWALSAFVFRFRSSRDSMDDRRCITDAVSVLPVYILCQCHRYLRFGLPAWSRGRMDPRRPETVLSPSPKRPPTPLPASPRSPRRPPPGVRLGTAVVVGVAFERCCRPKSR